MIRMQGDKPKLKDVPYLLSANVADIVQKAHKENWKKDAFDHWLRIKELQFLEKIAYK